jgi:hypothetical protein
MRKFLNLADIELGAEAYLRDPSGKTLSDVRRAELNEFYDAAEYAVGREWHHKVLALLLASEHRKAMDFLIHEIEDCQPDADELAERAWGDAADRGNDERD